MQCGPDMTYKDRRMQLARETNRVPFYAPVQVSNLGPNIVEFNVDDSGHVVRLGQNGTAFIDPSTPFKMGNASVRINQRVEVANTGEDIVRVDYTSSDGQSKTMLLGESGTGYFDKENSIKIGDVELLLVRH